MKTDLALAEVIVVVDVLGSRRKASRAFLSVPAAGVAALARSHEEKRKSSIDSTHAVSRAAYHASPNSLRTSPSRKIDPAATIRRDRRHAAASASRGPRLDTTGQPAARRVARARPVRRGSAARAFEARVKMNAPTTGASAASIAGNVLVAHRREHHRRALRSWFACRNAASAAAPSGL